MKETQNGRGRGTLQNPIESTIERMRPYQIFMNTLRNNIEEELIKDKNGKEN